jgi:hypothetical protein
MKFYSGRPLSIQPPRDEPFALGFRYFELLDRRTFAHSVTIAKRPAAASSTGLMHAFLT